MFFGGDAKNQQNFFDTETSQYQALIMAKPDSLQGSLDLLMALN